MKRSRWSSGYDRSGRRRFGLGEWRIEVAKEKYRQANAGDEDFSCPGVGRATELLFSGFDLQVRLPPIVFERIVVGPVRVEFFPTNEAHMWFERVVADRIAHGLVAVVGPDPQEIAALVVLTLVGGEAVADEHIATGEVAAGPRSLSVYYHCVAASSISFYDIQLARLLDPSATARLPSEAGQSPAGIQLVQVSSEPLM